MTYVRLCKRREKGRVVKVDVEVVFGTDASVRVALLQSAVSRAANVSFVERHNGTDRHRNARKNRGTYRFSKEWQMHEAMTYFTMYSYNFCWPVRTLASVDRSGARHPRTPAMAAGLTDHVWTLREWLAIPVKQLC